MDYLGINLMKAVQDLYLKATKHCWEKLRRPKQMESYTMFICQKTLSIV